MRAVEEAAGDLGAAAACAALGVPRGSFYRWRAPLHGPHPLPAHPRALVGPERAEVLAVLHEERFVDKAPVEVYATLLEEGRRLRGRTAGPRGGAHGLGRQDPLSTLR